MWPPTEADEQQIKVVRKPATQEGLRRLPGQSHCQWDLHRCTESQSMECLWEAHWTGPECEGSEGHQRSVGWTNRYHTVYNTYKCCTGHLFMKTAWPVSKVPLIHTNINTSHDQRHTVHRSVLGASMPATFVHMYTHMYVHCHPTGHMPSWGLVHWTHTLAQPMASGLQQALLHRGRNQAKRKYKWARLAAPAVQEVLVRAQVFVTNAKSLLVTSCPFQAKTLTDHALEDSQEEV